MIKIIYFSCKLISVRLQFYKNNIFGANQSVVKSNQNLSKFSCYFLKAL